MRKKNKKMTVVDTKKKTGKTLIALAGVAQWIEHRPVNQKVTGSIPSQGTCLGCGLVPQLKACKRQPRALPLAHSMSPTLMFLSLSFSLSSPLSKK